MGKEKLLDAVDTAWESLDGYEILKIVVIHLLEKQINYNLGVFAPANEIINFLEKYQKETIDIPKEIIENLWV